MYLMKMLLGIILSYYITLTSYYNLIHIYIPLITINTSHTVVIIILLKFLALLLYIY